MDRFTNNTIFQPIDILDGLGISTPDNKLDIALAIPGAGLDGIVPGTNSPRFAAIRLAKTFSGYISPPCGEYSLIFLN